MARKTYVADRRVVGKHEAADTMRRFEVRGLTRESNLQKRTYSENKSKYRAYPKSNMKLAMRTEKAYFAANAG